MVSGLAADRTLGSAAPWAQPRAVALADAYGPPPERPHPHQHGLDRLQRHPRRRRHRRRSRATSATARLRRPEACPLRGHCRRKHLPGGNRFDNMQIDIRNSFLQQVQWLSSSPGKKSVRRSAWSNYLKFLFIGSLQKKKWLEPWVMSGFIKGWFDEFLPYWEKVLCGRPITLMDFHQLRFLYRTKFQRVDSLSWEGENQHLENWQNPRNINLIFSNVYNLALHPIRYYPAFRLLKNNARILEYGCSLAPGYRSYKEFLNHKQARWVLADIPNFPYHFARYAYARDLEVEKMIVIDAGKFDDPLAEIEGTFDMIMILTVFEHLHKPRMMAEYLLDRLNKGGYFVFDYIKSEAKHLDSQAGLSERIPTLNFLLDRLELVSGSIKSMDESVDLCIGRKK